MVAKLSVSIEQATADDVERLREIEIDAGARFREIGLDSIADDDPPTAELLVDHIGAGTTWVATGQRGQLIGYVLASIVDGEAHLDQVSVIVSAAGHGVGRALIDVVLNWARESGLRTITLTTFRDVAWNGPYYRRLGFIDIGPEQMGPELTKVRANERRLGLDVEVRVAMRRSTLPL